MSPDRERRLEEIFSAARNLPPRERLAFLERACGGDAALRQQADSLLAAHEQAGQFLQPTVLVPAPNAPFEKPGDRIGHYKLLEQIGEGGFGVVWMAEQEEPVRRRVALKVIKLGMDTREVVARFEAERQALAMMDHPNIASVFDGGATHTGRPYFVMELVKGVPITDYCDANQLSTPERMELLIQVCHAVQHAHQKGVIHRDLKPSNILVTVKDDRPVPKVIDFGVAKATQARLTEKTVFTRFHQWIGTPAYMSPEQAGLGNLDVDTRSDIYSLGVLLYELLTGRPPFDTQKLLAGGYDAVMRTIREEEPPKPSTRLSTLKAEELTRVATQRHVDPAKLERVVRGDLDWIVMKALEKDRTRRYETANDFARDIQRHLGSEPVSAAAPGVVYRARKFVRRNRQRLAVGSLAVVAVALAVAAVKFALNLASEGQDFLAKGTNTVFTFAQSGDDKALTRLLNANPQLVHQRDASGATPLHGAASAGTTNTLRLLLARGAAVDAINSLGWTPLTEAAAKGRITAVAALLKAGADANHAAKDGQTVLFLAAYSGATEVGRLLLTQGAVADRASLPSQLTPWEIAATLGHTEFVELLRANGARPPSGTNVVFVLAHSDDAPTLRRALDANPVLVNERDAAGATPLSFAATAGTTNALCLLLARGAVVDATNNSGWTALMEAAIRGHVSAVAVLLEAGADPNHVANQGETALVVASVPGAAEVGRLLLAKGAQVEAAFLPTKRTALQQAAMLGHAGFAELLLAQGARTDAMDASGNTPLHGAASGLSPTSGIRALAGRLPELIAPSPGDQDGASALALASNLMARFVAELPAEVLHSGGDHRRVVELLLTHGAALEATNHLGRTPLWVAVQFTNEAVAQVLIAHKANLNARDTDGLAPLHVAVAREDRAVVARLLDAGADPNRQDWAGFTPLQTAVERNQRDIAELLLLHHADPNLACFSFGTSVFKGQTALHTAAVGGNLEMLRLLLDKGASICPVAGSDAPLAWAVKGGHPRAVELLLARGAQPNLNAPQSGMTALHWAALLGQLESATLLLDHGASNKMQSQSGTPLRLAVVGEEGAEQLLARILKPSLTNVTPHQLPRGTTADYVAVVRLLLTRGADADARDSAYQCTPLFPAVRAGNLQAVEALLAAGAKVVACDSVGATPLHAASETHAYPDVVSNIVVRLLQAGAAPDVRDNRQATPLHAAANGGRTEVAALLIAAGANVNAQGPYLNTPLHFAVQLGNRAFVELLLAKGADPERRNREGNTALHIAVLLKSKDLVMLLLQHGAEVNAGTTDGSTALMAAAYSGDPVMINFLLERGAKINAANQRGWTALRSAAQAGQLESARLLRERGAELETADRAGNTPLLIAAKSGQLEMVKFLLESGASLAARDNDGFTPLHGAADHGHAELVELFLGRRLGVDAPSDDGGTPLHYAANGVFTNETRYVEVARLLLAARADVNARMRNNQTPLHRAADWGRPQIIQLLLAAGANPNVRDDDGKTALDIAAVNDGPGLRPDVAIGRKECAHLLRAARRVQTPDAKVQKPSQSPNPPAGEPKP